MDLGTVTAPTDPAVWVIGMLRDPVIRFSTSSDTISSRSAYWRSKYTFINGDATTIVRFLISQCKFRTRLGYSSNQITDFLQDYPNAVQRAEALDSALEKNASTISSHYADLVALTARQVMGATELTVGTDANGNLNLSDVKMFMKNVGSIDPTER